MSDAGTCRPYLPLCVCISLLSNVGAVLGELSNYKPMCSELMQYREKKRETPFDSLFFYSSSNLEGVCTLRGVLSYRHMEYELIGRP